MVYILVVGGGNIIGYCELGLSYYLVGQQLYIIYVILALPRGAQWRPVSSVEISIGDPERKQLDTISLIFRDGKGNQAPSTPRWIDPSGEQLNSRPWSPTPAHRLTNSDAATPATRIPVPNPFTGPGAMVSRGR